MTTYNATPNAALPLEPPQRVLALMQRQDDLARRLLVLAEQQQGYYHAENAAELLEHMKRRQHVVDDIRRGQEELSKLAPDEAELETLFQEQQLEEYKDLRDALADHLARIAHLDKQGQVIVRKMRDEVAARLGQVAAGQGAVAGYGRNQNINIARNRYTDRSA